MDFKKKTIYPGCYRRSGETGDHATVTARRLPCPSRKLHTVRGVEDHRVSHRPENREGAEIDHEVIVAEADPPLGQHQVGIASRGGFLKDMCGIPGGEELPLLDIYRPGLTGYFTDKVGLAAEKRGYLEDIEDPGSRFDLLDAMDVGEDGAIELLPDLLENRRAPGSARVPGTHPARSDSPCHRMP